MNREQKMESHRSNAIARGPVGEAIIIPDEKGIWRYTYDDGGLDQDSLVNLDNPHIKMYPEATKTEENSRVHRIGAVANRGS